MTEELIKTLLAERGKKYDETGEAIATLNRSIVFMPRGAEPGKQYRVRLIELRADARGRMMYRAEPAPAEAAERWLDNGDGAVSRVEVSIDWKLVEHQVSVAETRSKATREGVQSSRVKCTPVFGVSLAESFVEEVRVIVTPLEEEAVQGGQLVWVQTGMHEEPQPAERFECSQVEVVGGEWSIRKLHSSYDDNWNIHLRVTGSTRNGGLVDARLTTTWGVLPAWLRAHLSAQYQVCSCGRERRDVQVADSYGKCELCRHGETCTRCGKQKRVISLSGLLVCDTCEPLEQQEEFIQEHLTHHYRDQIAAEAKRLLNATAVLPQEAALIVLKAGLAHVIDESDRGRILEQCKRYRWYLFTPEGIFGTKLDQTAVQLLQYLPNATGNPLVEFVAWIVGGTRPSTHADSDFYCRTQMNGETVANPAVAEHQLKHLVEDLAAGKPVLADLLRGSDADLNFLSDWLGGHSYGRRSHDEEEVVTAVERALQSIAQDYTSAVAQVREFEAKRVQREALMQAGEVWMDVVVDVSTESRVNTSVWCLAPDGSFVEPIGEGRGFKDRLNAYRYGDLATTCLVVSHAYHNYGYRRTEKWEVHYLPKTVSAAQQAKITELTAESAAYFHAPGAAKNAPTWDLSRVGVVTYRTEHARNLQDAKLEAYWAMCEAMPIDPREYRCQAIREDGNLTVEVFAQKRPTPATSPILAAMREAGLVDEQGRVLGSEREA